MEGVLWALSQTSYFIKMPGFQIVVIPLTSYLELGICSRTPMHKKILVHLKNVKGVGKSAFELRIFRLCLVANTNRYYYHCHMKLFELASLCSTFRSIHTQVMVIPFSVWV